MQCGLRQDQIDLAVETRITQAHDHRSHQASENTTGQPHHQVGACRLPPCAIIALIVGEDPVTAPFEFYRRWGLKNHALAAQQEEVLHVEGEGLCQMLAQLIAAYRYHQELHQV